MKVTKLTLEEKAALTPQEYRLMCRQEEWSLDDLPQSCCQGYSQHALVILPQDYAFEFLAFCVQNPRACYVSDICESGSPHPLLLAPEADVRTDCNRYRVYKDGEVIDEPRDIMKYWRDDLVSFLLPCSYGFEGVLKSCGIKFRGGTGAYITSLKANSIGRFKSVNLVVTCRFFQSQHDAIRAVQVTSRLPVTHGAPIHIGDPTHIGIKDITKPDYYLVPVDPPQSHEVMLFWACAMTPENAIKVAKPPLAIMHWPGMVFVSDHLTEEFAYTEEIGSNLV
ncbi:MAG: D-glutamate cyclase family protein [Candidatus Thorarchaeota archaeon]|jgi:uncharacterized protein YcsI (UPF0317 family)